MCDIQAPFLSKIIKMESGIVVQHSVDWGRKIQSQKSGWATLRFWDQMGLEWDSVLEEKFENGVL